MMLKLLIFLEEPQPLFGIGGQRVLLSEVPRNTEKQADDKGEKKPQHLSHNAIQKAINLNGYLMIPGPAEKTAGKWI